MRYGVDARCARETLGSVHHHIGVNDCHFGHKLIIGKRIFNAAVFIGDNRKGSYLTARARCCGNCDEIGLFSHLGEGVNTLSDIGKAHCHIHEIGFGMLIENPHNFCGIHCRAAADCDNNIRLKRSHLSRTLSCACKCRVGSDIIESGVNNAHFVELVGYCLGIAVLIKEAVGNNKGFLLVHNIFKLSKSNGQTAFLDINLFRCSEPQHIFPSFSNGFDIEQVLNANILRNGVASP